MKLLDFYPIIVTEKLADCRDFYVRWFGLSPVFESSWFVLLASDEGQASLAFMSPDHPSAPPGPETFDGRGMCLEFQVENAAEEAVKFQDVGLGLPLTDEPFGQRRFGLFDPAGTWIDVVEQIEPQQGWWDQYMV